MNRIINTRLALHATLSVLLFTQPMGQRAVGASESEDSAVDELQIDNGASSPAPSARSAGSSKSLSKLARATSEDEEEAIVPSKSVKIEHKLLLPSIEMKGLSDTAPANSKSCDPSRANLKAEVKSLRQLIEELNQNKDHEVKVVARNTPPARPRVEVKETLAPRQTVSVQQTAAEANRHPAQSSRVVSPLPSYNRARIASKNPPRCRVHPITHRTKTHAGCDMGAASGSPILAVMDGTVVDTGNAGGYGNMVTIRHKLANGKTVYSRYAHMRAGRGDCRFPREGAKIRSGDKIGCVGSTGFSTGPHLHFEIRSSASGGTIYDSKHFLLNNGELKLAKTCGRR